MLAIRRGVEMNAEEAIVALMFMNLVQWAFIIFLMGKVGKHEGMLS